LVERHGRHLEGEPGQHHHQRQQGQGLQLRLPDQRAPQDLDRRVSRDAVGHGQGIVVAHVQRRTRRDPVEPADLGPEVPFHRPVEKPVDFVDPGGIPQIEPIDVVGAKKAGQVQ
jgi:hypothetical protein